MTRKDYKAMAAAIAKVPNVVTRRRLADTFAEIAEADNPRFDRDTFLEACNPLIANAVKRIAGLKARAIRINRKLGDKEFDPDLEAIFDELSKLLSIEAYNAFQDKLTKDWERRNWK